VWVRVGVWWGVGKKTEKKGCFVSVILSSVCVCVCVCGWVDGSP
jgi:hypothetical protein